MEAKPGTSKKFIINGREYGSIEEMSPQDLQVYLDAMQKLKSRRRTLDPGNTDTVIRTETSKKYVLEGKAYNSIDELPVEFREAVRSAKASMPQASGAGTSIGQIEEIGRSEVIRIDGRPSKDPPSSDATAPIWLFFLVAAAGAGLILWLLIKGHII